MILSSTKVVIEQVPPPKSSNITPSSFSVGVSTVLDADHPLKTMSSILKPNCCTHFTRLCRAEDVAEIICASTSSLVPDIPIGSLISPCASTMNSLGIT